MARLIAVVQQLGSSLGVGIDEDACLFVDGLNAKVYGRRGVFVVDGSNSVKASGKWFQIKNMKAHYLTEGDSFDLKTRTVQSSKTLISEPQFQGYADSGDILSAYECTRLMTHLVDQRSPYNIGKTKTPEDEDYPEGTPTF